MGTYGRGPDGVGRETLAPSRSAVCPRKPHLRGPGGRARPRVRVGMDMDFLTKPKYDTIEQIRAVWTSTSRCWTTCASTAAPVSPDHPLVEGDMTMEKMSWRKTILTHLAEDEEVAVDTLHEGSEDDDDLDLAMEAAEALALEGLAWDDHGVIKPRVGKEAAIRAALAAC